MVYAHNIHMEFLVFRLCHRADDCVYRGYQVVQCKFLNRKHDFPAFDFGNVQNVID